MQHKEKQALREKADWLQEESRSLQMMIDVKEEAILLEEKINLQDQLIDALVKSRRTQGGYSG